MAFTIPNMRGRLYLGSSMTTDPVSLGDFEFKITDPKYGTTNVGVENDIASEDKSIYGQTDTTKIITGRTRTYTVGVMVDPVSDPEFYDWLEALDKDPLGEHTLISLLDTYEGASKDFFTPEAVVSISNSPHFGEAGALVEVELEIVPKIGMKEITSLPEGELENAPVITAPATTQYYAIAAVATYGQVLTDLGITAMSGDGVTDLTSNIEIYSDNGTLIPPTTNVDTTIANTFGLNLKVVEAGKEDNQVIVVQVSTSGTAPAMKK